MTSSLGNQCSIQLSYAGTLEEYTSNRLKVNRPGNTLAGMDIRSRGLLASVLIGLAAGGVVRAEGPVAAQAAALFDPAKHMRTSEVKPGMKGFGVSVFSGTKLEKFDVEVISVLKNQMGPQQDVVLIRCAGQGLEHSGAVAGMSGSPIYLTDEQGRTRMIGAFALGWQFAKDPIAGVRPIEEMLRVPAGRHANAREVAKELSTWDARPTLQHLRSLGEARTSSPAPLTTSANDLQPMRPLAVPLSISGVSEKFVEQMRPMFAGSNMMLLQAGGAGDAPDNIKDAKLEPGAAIGVPIVTGDLELSAIGTVTEVVGDKVFAFGHEFNSEGAVELPMGVGYVHSVIANQAISFKLGSMIRTDGAIYSDESVAIAGTIGKTPPMIPVEITVHTPQRQAPIAYKYQVARHPRFTPFGTINAIASAITGHSQLPSEFTINYSLDMHFDGDRVLSMKNSTTSLAGAMELIRDLNIPVGFALENPFSKVYPSKITGEVTLKTQIDADLLRSASTDKQIYKPGETVRLFVTTRPHKGKDVMHTYDVKLPTDLPDGPIGITVSDAQRYMSDQMRFAPAEFQADNIDDVFSLIKSMTADRSDKIYIRLALPREGVSIGRTKLANLPGSKRQLLVRTPTVAVAPYPESIVTTHEFGKSLMGSADVTIMVAKHPDRAAMPASGVQTPQPQPMPQQPSPEPAEESPHE